VIAVGSNGTALLDNGDRLSDAALAALACQGGRQCVFAGPPALAERLVGHLPSTEIVALAPMAPDDARAHLAMWLVREDLPRNRFKPEAVAELIAAAAVVPPGATQLPMSRSERSITR
jgi:hypothetical protein